MNWNSAEINRSIAVLQLTASALALSLVHLLNRENQNRSGADIRLRIFESESETGGRSKPQSPRFKLEAPGLLYNLGFRGSLKGLPITTVEMSNTCLHLISPQKYSENMGVRVECYDVQFTGKVDSSLPVVGGFLVRVSLDDKVAPETLNSMLGFHRRHMAELLAMDSR